MPYIMITRVTDRLRTASWLSIIRRQDTLWVHCDTIRVRTLYINTDSVQREVHCYNHVRAYRRDIQAVCDSLVLLSKDSCATLYKDPIVWNNGSQLLGEKINIYSNDSTVRYAEVLGQALSVEQLTADSTYFNQVSSRICMLTLPMANCVRTGLSPMCRWCITP